MKIKLNEDAYVDFSDGLNYTLYLKKDVIKKKTNEVEREWVFQGYYPNLGSAMVRALEVQVMSKSDETKIETYYELLQGHKEHTVKYFNERAKELGIKRKSGD